MIRRALLAFQESRMFSASFWLASGLAHIGAGMFLGAALTSTVWASPVAADGLDADWGKIITLLLGLVGVYVALERRISSLELTGAAQRDLHAAQLREWVATQSQVLRETLLEHGHRIAGLERQHERDAK